MKKVIGSFAGQVLSKQQMKSVKGGELCRVCSGGGPSEDSGSCGSYSLSAQQAASITCEMLDQCDGYYYTYDCV